MPSCEAPTQSCTTRVRWSGLVVRTQPKHASPVSDCGPQMAPAFKAGRQLPGDPHHLSGATVITQGGYIAPRRCRTEQSPELIPRDRQWPRELLGDRDPVPKDTHTLAGVTSLDIW